jgi:hypothetical protein
MILGVLIGLAVGLILGASFATTKLNAYCLKLEGKVYERDVRIARLRADLARRGEVA